MLTIQSAMPDSRLEPFVRSYVQRQTGAEEDEIVEPVVARLGAMLEFQFDRLFDVEIYGRNERRVAPRICVIGPMTCRTYKLLLRDHVETLTVLFRPQGFRALFDLPMTLVADTGIEGHSILGGQISRLFEQLGNARTFTERIQLLDHYLLRRLNGSEPLKESHRALAQLALPGNCIKVAELAFRAGISARQLERRSLNYVGVSPKLLARIARFQQALRMKVIDKATWSYVAHHLDYFDQTHMIRDFRDFAGDAPVRVLQQTAPDHLIHL